MKLLTQELRDQIPKLYAQEHEEDPMVYCRFFVLFTYWEWYVTEFDGVDRFFGMVYGHEKEMGYFSLAELESVVVRDILTVRRDLEFTPRRLSVVEGEHHRAAN